MNVHDRDLLIRQALTPATSVQAPSDLGDEIYRALLLTPQRRAVAWQGVLGGMPVPATLWLLLLVGILAAGALFALSRIAPPPEPDPPGVVSTYHGGPERTGIMPGPGPSAPVEIAWTVSRSGPISFGIMPVVAANTAFVGDASGAFSALDVVSGTERWLTVLDAAITASPVLVDDLVITATEAGEVVALEQIGGAARWRTDVGASARASLAIANGLLFVGTDAGELVALDSASGVQLWESNHLGGPVTRGPAIADGTLYVGAEGGRLSAITIADHEVAWTTDLGPGGLATPALANGLVYTATGVQAPEAPHALVALDPTDGRERWRYTAPTGEGLFVSAVDARYVYAGSEDFNVYALDADSGDLAWTFGTQGVVGSLATLVDGVLYVSSGDHHVYAVDAATGRALWQIEVEGTPTIPVVVDGRTLVGTDRGVFSSIVGAEPRPEE